jgi:hypothetical protein
MVNSLWVDSLRCYGKDHRIINNSCLNIKNPVKNDTRVECAKTFQIMSKKLEGEHLYSNILCTKNYNTHLKLLNFNSTNYVLHGLPWGVFSYLADLEIPWLYGNQDFITKITEACHFITCQFTSVHIPRYLFMLTPTACRAENNDVINFFRHHISCSFP